MFLGIDRDEWIQLWAGLLGAVPAAILSAAVAAWVAVTVLNRSNEHQKGLAADAVEEQRNLSDLQLAEQRTLSNLQLVEQRREAAVVRERAAAAEVIIAAQDFIPAVVESGDAVTKQQGIFRTAVTRWWVELGPGEMSTELMDWPNLLFRAASRVVNEEASGTAEEGERANRQLADAIGVVMASAVSWGGADEVQRKALVDRLRGVRLKLMDQRADWDRRDARLQSG